MFFQKVKDLSEGTFSHVLAHMSFTITECQTAQAAQIWFQNVHFNLLKKLCDEIRVLIVLSLKYNVLQKRTVRASMLRM